MRDEHSITDYMYNIPLILTLSFRTELSADTVFYSYWYYILFKLSKVLWYCILFKLNEVLMQHFIQTESLADTALYYNQTE